MLKQFHTREWIKRCTFNPYTTISTSKILSIELAVVNNK